MANDTTELPEGTDRVIPGAGLASGSEDNVANESKPLPPATRDRLVEGVRSGRDKLASQAADRTRGFVGQGLERSSEALANVSRLVGDTAAGLDERLGAEYGDYARKAAGYIEETANKLAAKDADELIEDAREFVRKSPGAALAGAAVVGFVLARLVKTGLDNGKTDA